jgi:hypothetical protein
MWKRRDWICTGLAAGAAFGLTLAAFLPNVATAVDPAVPVPVVDTPKLKFDGFEISARLVKDDNVAQVNGSTANLKAGPAPKFQVEAINTGTAAATVEFSANLATSNVRDNFSRVPSPRKSTPEWTQSYTLTLKPGETQVVDIDTGAKVGPNSVATLGLESGKLKINALTMMTAGPAVLPISAPVTIIADGAPPAVVAKEQASK